MRASAAERADAGRGARFQGMPLDPHGHRAHRPRRARVRHLLAPAQRAHRLPWPARRRPGRQPRSSRSCCTWSPSDPDKDISIYINSPGGVDLRGPGDLRHDAVHQARRRRRSACGDRDVDGLAAADRRRQGQALLAAQQPDPHPPAVGRASRARRPTSRSTRGRSSRRARGSTRSTPTTRARPSKQVHADMERDRFFKPDAGRRVRPDRPRHRAPTDRASARRRLAVQPCARGRAGAAAPRTASAWPSSRRRRPCRAVSPRSPGSRRRR